MKHLASRYVGKAMQFHIVLSDASFFWIFCSLYNLGGPEACGIGLLATSSGISDLFMREVICTSFLLVGSVVSFL